MFAGTLTRRAWAVPVLLGSCLALTGIAYGSRTRPLPLWGLLLSLPLLTSFFTWAAARLQAGFLGRRLGEYPRGARFTWVGGTGAAALVLYFALPVPPLAHVPAGCRLAVAAAVVVTLAYGLLLAGLWLSGVSFRAAPGSSWLGYAACCAVVWTVYLLLFWPGLLNADSFDQWRQMQTGDWNDHHPVFHTFCNWLVTRLWNSPAAVALVQIVALSVVVGLGLSLMRAGGLPRVLAALTCLGVALAPANGMMVIYLTKDTAFTIALLALTFQVLATVQSGGRWLDRRWSWCWLGGAAALTMLFRQNGVIAAGGTLLLLLVCYRRCWRPLARALLLTVLVYGGVRGPGFQWLGVKPSPYMPFLNLVAVHHIAAHLAAGEKPAPAEQALLDRLRPPAAGWSYQADTSDGLFYDGKFDHALGRKSTSELLCLARDWHWRAPRTALRHLAGSTSYLWRILPEPGSQVYGVCVWLDPDGKVRTMDPRFDASAFPPHPLLPHGQYRAATWIEKSYSNPKWNWFLWRPALYLYLGLAASLVAVARSRSAAWLLVLAPCLLNTASIALFACSQTHRYGYPLQLAVLALAGFLVLGVPRAPTSVAEFRPREPQQPEAGDALGMAA